MTSFYNKKELQSIGIKEIGKNVLISRKACFYNASKIRIGNNTRIDDFCILSGNVTIGNNVHIAAYSALYGADEGIIIEDFSNISSRVCVYAVSDDYSGKTMTNPTISDKYKNVTEEKVIIKRHSIIGSGSTILPGVTLNEGTAIGAMSLVKKSTEEWGIYAGIPVKRIKDRDKSLLLLEREFLLNEGK